MTKSLADIINENSNAHLSLLSDKGFTVREIQICADCKGDGEVTVTEDMGHSKGLEESVVTCQSCKGSGRIEAFITIIRKPFKPTRNG